MKVTDLPKLLCLPTTTTTDGRNNNKKAAAAEIKLADRNRFVYGAVAFEVYYINHISQAKQCLLSVL